MKRAQKLKPGKPIPRRYLLRNPPRSCAACGCTDLMACDGGCSWVLPGLCSKCVAIALRVFSYLAGERGRE